MEATFWKLSMGPGDGTDFPDLLHVLDWLKQGYVLVHKDTPAMGQSKTRQGDDFVHQDRIGDYFYLCHGNRSPSVLLLGQFIGPADIISPFLISHGERKNGWAARPFRWIKTAIESKEFKGEKRWWTPNERSTFILVKQKEMRQFEESILRPFFDLRLSDFGIKSSSG